MKLLRFARKCLQKTLDVMFAEYVARHPGGAGIDTDADEEGYRMLNLQQAAGRAERIYTETSARQQVDHIERLLDIAYKVPLDPYKTPLERTDETLRKTTKFKRDLNRLAGANGLVPGAYDLSQLIDHTIANLDLHGAPDRIEVRAAKERLKGAIGIGQSADEPSLTLLTDTACRMIQGLRLERASRQVEMRDRCVQVAKEVLSIRTGPFADSAVREEHLIKMLSALMAKSR
jgi:hypothetical protein